MKKFRYKFRPITLAVMISAIVIAAAGTVLNILRFIKFGGGDSYGYLSLIIALIISVVGLVMFSAMIISSSYKVTDEELILSWGFLKNKLPIDSISRIVFDEIQMKLVIYYQNDNFFVLNAKTVEYTELVEELKRRNDKIVYEISSLNIKSDDDKK